MGSRWGEAAKGQVAQGITGQGEDLAMVECVRGQAVVWSRVKVI